MIRWIFVCFIWILNLTKNTFNLNFLLTKASSISHRYYHFIYIFSKQIEFIYILVGFIIGCIMFYFKILYFLVRTLHIFSCNFLTLHDHATLVVFKFENTLLLTFFQSRCSSIFTRFSSIFKCVFIQLYLIFSFPLWRIHPIRFRAIQICSVHLTRWSIIRDWFHLNVICKLELILSWITRCCLCLGTHCINYAL